MSSTEGTSKAKLYGILALAGVAVCGAIFCLMRGGEKDEGGADFSSSPPPKKRSSATDDSKLDDILDEAGAEMASVGPQSSMSVARDYDFGTTDNNREKVPQNERADFEAFPGGAIPDADGYCRYPNLGVSIPLAPGWIAAEDMQPMPNVAVISITKPEFQRRQTQMPGEIPVVLISVEDILHEGLTAEEFREKSKKMALAQMFLMTQGMYNPEVLVDDKIDVGPFTHCLEYKQTMPQLQMRVMNLSYVDSGYAYILQLMGAPQSFQAVKKDVMQMARNLKITPPKPDGKPLEMTFIEVKKEGGAKCKVPSQWVLQKLSADAPASTVFEFRTGSTAKPELIRINSCPLSEIVSSNWQPVESKSDNDVVRTFSVGGHRRKVACKEKTTVTVQALAKEDCVTDNEILTAVLHHTKHASQNNGSVEAYYVNKRCGYSFQILPGSKVMESRMGDRTVVYVPFGLPSEPDQMQEPEEGPVMTIRSGDPTNDPDCRPTLKEWYQRIQEESAEGLSQLKMEKVYGRDAVTFINKEMQEVGPGKTEERQAKVVIFLQGMQTTMIRWETCAGGLWKKHERDLERTLKSFELFDE